ncbi:MAG: GNAT family N-acetyltransferase [Hyphomicrobiaceae bacterium]|nr:MAG: GNAT family N-acetyltransferase [Hyphomicrobiaceae bacterium]
MAFLRSTYDTDVRPLAEGGAVTLRPPQIGDYAAWAALREASREHLVPWEPTWGPDELSRASYKQRLRHYVQEAREGTGYAFFLARASDGALLGGLSLSNVRRGVTQSASIGYWIGAPYARQGYMTAGVRAALPFVFDFLSLHRLDAACLPSNAASIAVLERNGFHREGMARSYLKINGKWQDHLLFARLADRPYRQRV